MPEPYEELVREYLELKGWLVLRGFGFKKEKGGRSDADIVAIKIIREKPKVIVAEVKGTSPIKKEIDMIYEHLTHENLQKELKEKLGIKEYDKWIYCWDLGKDTEEIKKYAETEYGIKIETFPKIIKFLLDEIKEAYIEDKWLYYKRHPNTMLLQILVDSFSKGILKPEDFLKK